MSAPTDPILDELREVEERVFRAIAARDTAALEAVLAADFVLSSLGQPEQGRKAFVAAIRDATYRILEIRGEDLRARELADGVALLSGVQRARVELPDGTLVAASTAFVDAFVRTADGWRLRHAVSVELPSA